MPGYRVGADGTVWTSKKAGRTNSSLVAKGLRKLTVKPGAKGYLFVRLYPPNSKKFKHYHVAALVLSAFVGARPPGHEASHKNGIRTDNRASNLCWKTHIENERDKIEHGTLLAGERVGNAKLTNAQVAEIKKLNGTMRQCDVAKLFNVSATTIRHIWQGKWWKAVAS